MKTVPAGGNEFPPRPRWRYSVARHRRTRVNRLPLAFSIPAGPYAMFSQQETGVVGMGVLNPVSNGRTRCLRPDGALRRPALTPVQRTSTVKGRGRSQAQEAALRLSKLPSSLV